MALGIILGIVAAALILIAFALIFTSLRGIKKALDPDFDPHDWTNDEVNLEPVKKIQMATGDADTFVTQCYFAIGLIGPQGPYKIDPKSDMQGGLKPRPYVGVVMMCDAADNPSGVVCTYDILEHASVGLDPAMESCVSGEKVKNKVRITIQTPVPQELAEDLTEKLNLYAKVPIKLHYKLVLSGNVIERHIDTFVRWKSPVQDEDLSAYIGQFRS